MFWNKKDKTETDPICLMKVKVENAKFKQDFEGKTYYFCSENCQKTFLDNPKNYQHK